MNHNISCIVIFLFVAQLSFAQNQYSESQLQSFVNIYMDSKNLPDDKFKGELISKQLTAYDISNERYKSIFKANMKGEKINLKQNEIAFFDKLKEIDQIQIKSRESSIAALCESKSMKYETYKSLRKQYRSDIKFQRSLKPYFDQYIKSKK